MVTKRILQYLKGASKLSKRQHARRRAFNLIKFTLSDGTSYESISNIVNISEAGLQFTCYEKIPPKSTLNMTIHHPDRPKGIALEAKLVWTRKHRNIRGVFVCGVSFDHITKEDKILIRNMVSRGKSRK